MQALHDGVSDAGAGAGGRSRGAAMQVAAAASSDPRLTAFPKEIVQCYNAIQNNRDKFNVVPVGPLGMEVSLDDSHKSWYGPLQVRNRLQCVFTPTFCAGQLPWKGSWAAQP